MRSFGCVANAIAIITRWAMPPLSSCGYMFFTRAASMPTYPSIFSTSASAVAGVAFFALRRVSLIWKPDLNTGFREDFGS
ncbi:MAG: hypothetical protein BWX67_02156 [Thermotogae bacterium ADurb.Bin062]|nr:MAG: hypothetical protein BWX67_02156 [Thermotogota bacterium ADurb.Bin062]